MQVSGPPYQHIPALLCALCGVLIPSTGLIVFGLSGLCIQNTLRLWLSSPTPAEEPRNRLVLWRHPREMLSKVRFFLQSLVGKDLFLIMNHRMLPDVCKCWVCCCAIVALEELSLDDIS